MSTVGSRIRKRREPLGWTQDDLAKKASISKSFLSDLENGKRNVGADKLLDIARALSLSLDYLMTGKDAEAGEALPSEVQIPKSLASFAADHGISFREVTGEERGTSHDDTNDRSSRSRPGHACP